MGDDFSNETKVKGEEWITHKFQYYYNKAKEIIFNNKAKLEMIAKELMNKKVLLQDDIKRIMEK